MPSIHHWRALLALGAYALTMSAALQLRAEEIKEPERGIPVEAATRQQKEVAKKQLILGVDLMAAGKLEEALSVLRMSLAKVASPNTRLLAARALNQLGRHVEAYEELGSVIMEARSLQRALPKYKSTADAAEQERALVREKVALLTVDVDGQLLVGGKIVPPSEVGQQLVLTPGRVAVQLRSKAGVVVERSLELSAGEQMVIALELPREKAPSPPKSKVTKVRVGLTPSQLRAHTTAHGPSNEALAWTGGGLALAGLTGLTVFGVLNNERYERLRAACPDNECPASFKAEAEQGRLFQGLANVSLGLGLLGALGGGVFLYRASLGPESGAHAQVRIRLGGMVIYGRY